MPEILHLTAHPTIQATAAAGLAASVVWVTMPIALRLLASRIREPADTRVPALAAVQAAKRCTPTLGGIVVLLAIGLTVWALGLMESPVVVAGCWLAVGLAVVGLGDDLRKLRLGRGMAPKWKLLAQCAVVMPATVWLSQYQEHSTIWIAWAVLWIAGLSNAVNLTDGLDGLASGLSVMALLGQAAVLLGPALMPHDSAVAGTLPIAQDRFPLALWAVATAGGLLGFLYFNQYPARVFLGNVGSLSLGGTLGYISLASGSEWPMAGLGLLFAVEAASVVLQVLAFRLTGKRVFRCAPLHHHFQLLSWPEPVVVRAFWWTAAGCVTLSLVLTAAVRREAASVPPSRPLTAFSPESQLPAPPGPSHSPPQTPALTAHWSD